MRTHWEKSLPKEIINLNILTRGRFNKIFPFFFSFPKEIMPKYIICNPTFYSLRMTNVLEVGAPFPPQKKEVIVALNSIQKTSVDNCREGEIM